MGQQDDDVCLLSFEGEPDDPITVRDGNRMLRLAMRLHFNPLRQRLEEKEKGRELWNRISIRVLTALLIALATAALGGIGSLVWLGVKEWAKTLK